jgi:predicted site-specific integrase-resolvase
LHKIGANTEGLFSITGGCANYHTTNYYTFTHKTTEISVVLLLPYTMQLIPSTTSQNVRGIMKRIAIYARVSTNKQNTENQIHVLKEIAKSSGYKIIHI